VSYFYQPGLFSYEEFVWEYDDNTRLVMVLSTLMSRLERLIAKFEGERLGRRDEVSSPAAFTRFQ
jgi:hypothetical protein